MKLKLEELLREAVKTLQKAGKLDKQITPNIVVERTRDAQHGDFASNLALTLAKAAKQKPRDLAQAIVDVLPSAAEIQETNIAGPGFINFFIAQGTQSDIIRQIHEQADRFGKSNIGIGTKVQIEFVSANPTGPLHVGHGRGAAYGSALGNLLTAIGYEVYREYYVNDAGRQMDILATTIWLRYLEECGEILPFPSNAYRGEYVRSVAKKIHTAGANEFQHPADLILEGLPADQVDGGDKEAYIDALIDKARKLLTPDQYQFFLTSGLDGILLDIKNDLEDFGVNFDEWFSERQLMDSGAVQKALNKLQESGHLYEKNGATWFACSKLGDEKDRVVVRENGQTTYLASDIAYHLNKLERGYDILIDIWGADHHGYVPRVKAAIQALGGDASKLKILLVQFAVLYRGKEKVSMSTRSGEFITLRQLRNEVGKDAARFFYMMRRCQQHMDFDLQLAMSQSNENPVYYVQYAHARVCSVFRQLDDKHMVWDIETGMSNLNLLTESHEQALLKSLSAYSETIKNAALKHEPHLLIQYLRELANDFHTYYNAHQFLVDDNAIRNARLNLVYAVRQIISNGLGLLDISAPETM